MNMKDKEHDPNPKGNDVRHLLKTTTGPALAMALLITLCASPTLAETTLRVLFDGPDPVPCGSPKTAVIAFDRDGTTPGLRGYEITLGINGPATIDTVVDAGGLAGAGLHQMYVVDNGDGSITVSDALLGSTPGLREPAELFTASVIANGDGSVELAILSYKLRDPENAPIYADTFNDTFTADCTLPPSVSDLAADPGHEKILVSWASADESDVDHYEIYRGLWYLEMPGVSAYPEYDDPPGDVIPTRPSDRNTAAASAEWVLAGTVPAGVFDFVDDGMEARGVYYYEVFPVDVAGNGGAASAQNARATNYWLGDIDLNRDGFVNVADISLLGASFGLLSGQAGYNNETDVGPTDDGTDMGVPLTDNEIDFEDLMIFSLNFSNVDPYKALPPSPGFVTLAWRRLGDAIWSLELDGPESALQGLRLRCEMPEGAACVANEGELLARQSPPVFLRETGSLDLSLALLGRGRGFEGRGELLRLAFDAPVDPLSISICARGTDNADLRIELRSAAVDLPTAYALAPNYPNPFNPATTIAFDLPRDGFVELAIYGLDGALVRRLISEPVPAGRHSAAWDGRDARGEPVASGLYLYRIEAGEFEKTRKMLLMK